MQSLESIEKRILEALSACAALGATARQISLDLGIQENLVAEHLSKLEIEGKAWRFGRGLWLASDQENISSLQGFVSASAYDTQFKDNFPRVSFSPLGLGVTFSSNFNRPIHRWSSYVQGFSADFVDYTIKRHSLGRGDLILDSFSGSGTTPLCAELKGIDAMGLDLSPLMTFISSIKTRHENFWLKPEEIEQKLSRVVSSRPEVQNQSYFPFLKETRKQFSDKVLGSLIMLKQSISENVQDAYILDLFMLAFTSILVQCSNLKRSPCLGYANKTEVPPSAPYDYFSDKVKMIVADLKLVRHHVQELGRVEIQNDDSARHKYKNNTANIAITSPPYANGLDYVTNYKIELAWLGSVSAYEDLRSLRNSMVASDNASRGSIDEFFDKRTIMVRDPWLEEIIAKIRINVKSKKTFRRQDMHLVIQKYFEDMYDTFQNVFDALVPGGKFVLVIGDSLTAGTYLPTDLILARIGRSIGFDVEEIELARSRRSGQRRSFKLRESIVTLSK